MKVCRYPVLVFVAGIGSAGCGGGTEPDGDEFALETGRSVSKHIGAAGGEIVTSDSRGRTYSLSVPPLALADSVLITLTPVAAFPPLPGNAPLLAGADFAPDGLELARPATLRIGGVSGGSGQRLRAFSYTDDGLDLEPVVSGGTATELLASVTHFSGIGTWVGLDADLPSGSAVQAYLRVDEIARREWTDATLDANYDALVAALTDWFTNVVKAGLEQADTDQEFRNAFARYYEWENVVRCGAHTHCSENLYLWSDGVGFLLQQSMQGRLAEGEALARSTAERAMAASVQDCIEDQDLAAAARANYWNKLIVLSGGEPADDPVADCVIVVIDQLTFPAAIAPGQPAQLRFVAGLSFGGQAPLFNRNLQVRVTASDATPALHEDATATGTGLYAGTFTPSGAAPVVLGVRVRWGQDGLADQLFRDTLIERNLGVGVALTPVAAILGPGASAQFAASVTGTTTTGVTWTVTGGTFTVSGNTLTYVAGSVPGTYSVTARSMADPARLATATVTIVGDAPPSPGIAVLDASGNLVVATAERNNPESCAINYQPEPPISQSPGPRECVLTGEVAKARAEWTFSTAATASSLTIDATVPASASHIGATSGDAKLARSTGALTVTFEVRNAPMRYTLTGALSVTGHQGTDWMVWSRVMLLSQQAGSSAPIEDGVTGWLPGVSTGTTALPLDRTGVLQPGIYLLSINGQLGQDGFTGGNSYQGQARSGTTSAQARLVLSPP